MFESQLRGGFTPGCISGVVYRSNDGALKQCVGAVEELRRVYHPSNTIQICFKAAHSTPTICVLYTQIVSSVGPFDTIAELRERNAAMVALLKDHDRTPMRIWVLGSLGVSEVLPSTVLFDCVECSGVITRNTTNGAARSVCPTEVVALLPPCSPRQSQGAWFVDRLAVVGRATRRMQAAVEAEARACRGGLSPPGALLELQDHLNVLQHDKRRLEQAMMQWVQTCVHHFLNGRCTSCYTLWKPETNGIRTLIRRHLKTSTLRDALHRTRVDAVAKSVVDCNGLQLSGGKMFFAAGLYPSREAAIQTTKSTVSEMLTLGHTNDRSPFYGRRLRAPRHGVRTAQVDSDVLSTEHRVTVSDAPVDSM